MGTLFFPITESRVGRSLHARPSLSCHREITSLYDQIYDGILKDSHKLKKSFSLHNSGNITFTLLAVKEVKK